MKHLVSIIKKIELEIRSSGNIISKDLWEELSNLTDWDYRIVQDSMLRVRLFMQNGDSNFVYKYYEKSTENIIPRDSIKFDIIIAMLKRDQMDTCLTDSWNSLIVPPGLTSHIIEVWGMHVTRARNYAVEQALKLGARYLLFVDDDIIAPNNALHKLYNDIITKDENGNTPLVVSGLYYKKYEPLTPPFENDNGAIEITGNIEKSNRICGMGFCLLDLHKITKKVPLPLFWEFGSPDGYWSMGEDAFFTKNLIEYTNNSPLVDTSIKCLHMDKKWKRFYGERDNEVVYCTTMWDSNNIKSFERLRVPPSYPLILICIPGRNEQEPLAINLDELMLLRGYRSELFRVFNKGVDEARNICAMEALKRNADYLLFIDNDIIPPQYGLSKLLETMEQINEPCVISGEYRMKGNPPHSAGLQLEPNNKRHKGIVTAISRTEKYKEGELFESNWLIGLGFALIDTTIFKQARQPWFKCYQISKDSQVNEDAHFSELTFDNGYKIYINPEVECLHADFKNQMIYGIFNPNIKYACFPEMLKMFRLFPGPY